MDKIFGVRVECWMIFFLSIMVVSFSISVLRIPEKLRHGVYNKLVKMDIRIEKRITEVDNDLSRRIKKLEKEIFPEMFYNLYK